MCVRNHFNHVSLDVRKLATVGETVTDGKGTQLARQLRDHSAVQLCSNRLTICTSGLFFSQITLNLIKQLGLCVTTGFVFICSFDLIQCVFSVLCCL